MAERCALIGSLHTYLPPALQAHNLPFFNQLRRTLQGLFFAPQMQGTAAPVHVEAALFVNEAARGNHGRSDLCWGVGQGRLRPGVRRQHPGDVLRGEQAHRVLRRRHEADAGAEAQAAPASLPEPASGRNEPKPPPPPQPPHIGPGVTPPDLGRYVARVRGWVRVCCLLRL